MAKKGRAKLPFFLLCGAKLHQIYCKNPLIFIALHPLNYGTTG
jgi:hypothetical protein